MTPQARQIINDVAGRRHLDPRAILGRRRYQGLVHARIEIARRLADRGYNQSKIAAILNRDHTTICFYLGKLGKQPSIPKWRPAQAKHLVVDCIVEIQATPKPVAASSGPQPYAGFDAREKRMGICR